MILKKTAGKKGSDIKIAAQKIAKFCAILIKNRLEQKIKVGCLT